MNNRKEYRILLMLPLVAGVVWAVMIAVGLWLFD